jgi:phosphoglycerol transferase MdoB-like AlkP superfamily enzyme
MPYDFPTADGWKAPKGDIEKKYTEAMHYADLQLGTFFDQAKKTKWYANTLFVLVADHSHNTTKQWSPERPERSHIPLLIMGGALKQEWRGQTWNKIVSQLDIVSTILQQLDLSATRYTWSRNILNPSTPSSAYYIFYGGQAYINDQGYAASYQGAVKSMNTNLVDSALIHKLHNKAMSFQQLVYETLSKKP